MEAKHLLIDAKNMLYRAIYTARGDRKFTEKGHHPFNIVLHFMTYYYEKFKPEHVHVFWDSRRDQTWRRDINSEYKENRSSSDPDKDREISDGIVNLTEVSAAVFKHMGVRQYYRHKMEADDLIYAFCRNNKSDKIVIVSSDSDLKQISFNFENVSIHHPLSKNGNLVEPIPEFDPVLLKCFVGDKSDNIEGYYRVGKVKGKVLCEDIEEQYKFFKSPKAIIKEGEEKIVVGSKRFFDNMKLIDLSLCPYLLDNMSYIMDKQYQPIKFDLKEIRGLISKYKLRGVTADITRYIIPFKKLEAYNGCDSSC